jgi:peptidoglycan/LPS O-acetylase OafA/YrhL
MSLAASNPFVTFFVGPIILFAMLCGLIYGFWDLFKRDDITWGKKTLWLIAFVLSSGLVAVFYGLSRASKDQTPTPPSTPKPLGG